MRRFRIIALLLVMLMLTSCGREAESSAALSAGENRVESDVLPRAEGLAAQTSEYILDGVDGSILSLTCQNGVMEFVLRRETTMSYCTYDMAEKTLQEIPLGEWDSDHDISRTRKDETGLWVQRSSVTWIDQNTGEADHQCSLHRLALDGTELCCVELEKNLFVSQMTEDGGGGLWAVVYSFQDAQAAKLVHLSETGEITEETIDIDLNSAWGLYQAEDGTLLILTDMRLYFWKNGEILGEEAVEYGEIVAGKDGSLYCANLGVGDALYAVDLEHYKLGEKVANLHGAVSIWTSGERYDFLLATEEAVLGLKLDGTAQELYSLTEVGTGMGVYLAELGEDHFLSLEYSLLLRKNVLKQIELVDETMLPEKSSIVLAVTADISQYLYQTDLVAQYNQNSKDWQVEVVEYADRAALSMALATGEQIDIISCGGSSNNNTFYQDCMEQGLLRNLYDCMEAAGEMTRDDLVSAYRRVAEEEDGGLYRLSSEFRVILVLGKRQYVGDDGTMPLEKLLEAAKTMPEGMALMQDNWRGALEMLLPLEQLVDWENRTCNFECQAFYDVMTLIRDYFPEEYDAFQELSEDPLMADEVLLQNAFGFGLADSVAVLAKYPEADFSVVGEPGRGIKIMLDDGYGITTACKAPEAAWDFLSTMLSAEVQERGFLGIPVVQSVFTQQKQAAVTEGTVTEQEMDRFLNVLEGDIYTRRMDAQIMDMVYEEAIACFAGDKSPEETAKIVENRVMIYLSERQ